MLQWSSVNNSAHLDVKSTHPFYCYLVHILSIAILGLGYISWSKSKSILCQSITFLLNEFCTRPYVGFKVCIMNIMLIKPKLNILFEETKISTTSSDAFLLFNFSKFDMQVLHNNNSIFGLIITFSRVIDWSKLSSFV